MATSPTQAPVRRSSWTRIPFYPVLFGLTLLANAFADSSVPLESLPRPLVVVVVAIAVVQLTASLVLRNQDAGAVVTSMIVLFLIDATVPLAFFATAAAATATVRLRQGVGGAGLWRPMTMVLNPLSLVAAVLALASTLAAVGPYAWAAKPETLAYESAPTKPPDIYLILLDGQPRDDVARREFGIERTLGDRLSGMGFDVAGKARSNYNMTALTIASMLNMSLVSDTAVFRDPPEDPPGQYRWLSKAINEGRSLIELRRLGYEIISVPSPFTNVQVIGDRTIDTGGLTYFETALLQVGRLPEIAPDLQRELLTAAHRNQIVNSIRVWPTLVTDRSAQPRFVFAHLMAPHPPPVFDAAGGPVRGWPCFPVDCTFWDGGQVHEDIQRQVTRGQVEYVNAIVTDAIATILAGSDPDPLVIVMSDHGHRHDLDDKVEMLQSFFAWRDPRNRLDYPDDASAVNTMARLLESLSDVDYPLAADDSFWVDMLRVKSDGLLDMSRVEVR